MSPIPSFFLYHFHLSLCMESTSYVLSFRTVFFYLVTKGWIFDISLLFENSTNIILGKLLEQAKPCPRGNRGNRENIDNELITLHNTLPRIGRSYRPSQH